MTPKMNNYIYSEQKNPVNGRPTASSYHSGARRGLLGFDDLFVDVV